MTDPSPAISEPLSKNELSRRRMVDAYKSDPEKFKLRAKAWREANPQRAKEIGQNSRFIARYGITLEKRNQLIDQQGNKCKVCSTEFNEKIYPCIDHCHKTNRVRGILCVGCNRAIGRLGDTYESLLAVASYLREANEELTEK